MTSSGQGITAAEGTGVEAAGVEAAAPHAIRRAGFRRRTGGDGDREQSEGGQAGEAEGGHGVSPVGGAPDEAAIHGLRHRDTRFTGG